MMASTPTEPTKAEIRAYTKEDEANTRMIVGRSAFEPLAVANQTVYKSPLTGAIYFGLASLFVQYLHWWPNLDRYGWIDLFRPLPIFAAMVLPVIFVVDFLQRPSFEDRTQARLKAPDVRSLTAHYTNPPSGLWILRLGSGFVGLVALDAADKQSTAWIRHLYVDDPFRKAGAQGDLLSFALNKAFAHKKIERVKMEVDPLLKFVRDGAKQTGFKYVEEVGHKFGLFGWRMQEWEVTRAAWEQSQNA